MDPDDGVPGGAGEPAPGSDHEDGGEPAPATGGNAAGRSGGQPPGPLDAAGGDRWHALEPLAEAGSPPGAFGQPPAGAGRRGPTVRVLTLLLAAVLVVVAAFGGTLGRHRVLRPASQTLPPVVQPTGQLAAAFRSARQASLRIEARCGNEPIGVGTGFFIRSDGLVLTAYHVVDPTEQGAPCAVRYVGISPERLEYPLTLVGFDAYHDLAVMRAAVGRAVPTIPLAPDLPKPGTKVVAVGNSRQQFLKARAGEVTRLGVHAGRPDFANNTIELTTSLAPGDSGGPVVDAAGKAVGVVSYISFDPRAMTSSHYVPPFLRGVPLPQRYASYAVPVGGSDLVARLEAGERRDVPVVGFTWRPGFDYDPATSDQYLGPRAGVIVWQVQPGGPADRAGLRSFREERSVTRNGSVSSVPRADVITALDGTPTPTFYDLLALVRKKRIGQTVTLTVERGNATLQIPLQLGAERSVFSQR